MSSNANNPEDPAAQDTRFGFECLRNIRDGKVDLVGVGEALDYKNVNSVGNRFRKMRDKYGFIGLECTTNGSPAKEKTVTAAAPAESDDGIPTKRKPGRPAKKAGARKGAKLSTADPIPATGPVVNSGDDSAEEAKEAGGYNFVEKLMNNIKDAMIP
ncbi:hypothetical protein BDW62DRAFT_218949 [Aspergillus aurantiobrunneus]